MLITVSVRRFYVPFCTDSVRQRLISPQASARWWRKLTIVVNGLRKHRFNQQIPCSIYHIINIFTIFVLLNEMLSMAKKYYGDKFTPETGAKNGDYGRAD